MANGRSLKRIEGSHQDEERSRGDEGRAERLWWKLVKLFKTAMTIAKTLSGRTVELDKQELNLNYREKGPRQEDQG